MTRLNSDFNLLNCGSQTLPTSKPLQVNQRFFTDRPGAAGQPLRCSLSR